LLISLRNAVRWVEHHGYWNPWDLNSSWFDSYLRNRRIDRLHRALIRLFRASEPTPQRLAAISIADQDYQLSSHNPPNLDIIVVAHPKDFITLPATISSVILNSTNPIRKCLIYVPEFALAEARKLSNEISKIYKRDIDVVSEKTLVTEETMRIIRDTYRERSGWLLQQILKLEAVLKGDQTPKLIIDADTAIVSRQLFLDYEGRQLLHVSSECQASYYSFLSELADLPTPFNSHVSHHMVMQRDILNQIMIYLGIASTHDLVKRALDYCGTDPTLTVSLDYEFYGQFARALAPDRIRLSRLCNLAVRDLPPTRKTLDKLLTTTSRNYKSVSFHAYLREAGS